MTPLNPVIRIAQQARLFQVRLLSFWPRKVH